MAMPRAHARGKALAGCRSGRTVPLGAGVMSGTRVRGWGIGAGWGPALQAGSSRQQVRLVLSRGVAEAVDAGEEAHDA
jgi:hypothetical protein